MDPRLLQYYERELAHLRELGSEFVSQFPVARGLGLDAYKLRADADPYVERLLEGVAFLAARVQLKIDAEFPRFTDHLLEMVYPHYLPPMPSIAVVQLNPDASKGVFAEGFPVPRDTSLRVPLDASDKTTQTACEYRTAHPVTIWPLEIAGLRHSTQLSDLGAPRVESARKLQATLRLQLRTQGGVPVNALSLDRLPLFVRGHNALGLRLYELLMAGAMGWMLRSPGGEWSELQPATCIAPHGFEEEQALLRYVPQSFRGYRLLQEYFALPSRFLFVELRNLNRALRRCEGTQVELAVLLDRHDPTVEIDLASRANPSQKPLPPLELHCTPAINLFPKSADRIHLTGETNEYQVIPDRARPLDFEVHSLTSVSGYAGSPLPSVEFQPFYSSKHQRGDTTDDAYFTIQRRPRQRQARTTDYAGSDVFVALVDGQEGPHRRELKQLGVETLCTNRDLPFELLQRVGAAATDFVVQSGAPIESCRCVAGPSLPRGSLALGGSAWRLISHLSLNYLSLATRAEPTGAGSAAPRAEQRESAPAKSAAASLRELMRLYAAPQDPLSLQIDALSSVATRRVVRRVTSEGMTSFARGLELTLECDESAFQGSSLLLFGSVLERFFARYVSINSFVETVLRSPQRELKRWPARLGARGSL